MLTRKQKEKIVEKLTRDIQLAKAAVFIDFKGLKVKEMTELKKILKKEGATLGVFKKNLMNIALKNAMIDVSVKEMEGQVAVSISENDELIPAKIIDKFSKKNESVKILGGILEGKNMSVEEVIALAKLPGKDELLAKLVGSINAPVSGLVNVLGGNLRGLVNVLKAVADNKA